ncbi:CUB domain-containing protein 2-like [Saccoglossus kowalevskii]
MNNKVAVVLSIIWTIFILPVQCILTGHFVLKEKRSLCEHNFNSDSGEFTSSNYPDKYPSNQDCYYYITVKSGLFVKLEFTRFDIEEILDYVEIYDGSSTTGRHIGTYSGSTLPPVIISSTPSISLYFHSDDLLERLGFRVTYKAVNTSNEGECGGTYYSDYGVITSPNYPMPYPNNAACYYFITMLNETSLVQLKFTYFSTEFGLDYVSVIDGSTKSGYQLGRYFGQYPSGILAPLSSGPSIIVYFYSDDAVQHFGFSATFRSTKVEVEEPVECDGTFTSAWDIVRSPNFPDVYLNSQVCYYYIQVAHHYVILLQFTTMDTEETYDVIEILDGDCSSENIGIYSGYALLPVIASSGPSMCLNFHTDSSTVRGGFEAFYTITPLDRINGNLYPSHTLSQYHPTKYNKGYTYNALSHPTKYIKGHTNNALSHPTKYNKGHTQNALSHPTKYNKGHTHNALSHPTKYNKGYTYNALSHPTKYKKGHTYNALSHPTKYNKGHTYNAHNHPTKYNKGYTYNALSHPT